MPANFSERYHSAVSCALNMEGHISNNICTLINQIKKRLMYIWLYFSNQ
jgi:hypothetical protein